MKNASVSKKLTLDKTTLLNVHVRAGVKAGPIMPATNDACLTLTRGWNCVR